MRVGICAKGINGEYVELIPIYFVDISLFYSLNCYKRACYSDKSSINSVSHSVQVPTGPWSFNLPIYLLNGLVGELTRT